MPIAARDASDRVEQLITLVERLTGLIETEQAVLSERRPAALLDHAPERDKLTAVYAQEMALIKQNRALIDTARPDLLQSLKSVTARFRTALQEHDSRLAAIRSVSEGMIRAVGRHAQAKTQAVTGYGKDAGLRTAQTGPAASLALNQVI